MRAAAADGGKEQVELILGAEKEDTTKWGD